MAGIRESLQAISEVAAMSTPENVFDIFRKGSDQVTYVEDHPTKGLCLLREMSQGIILGIRAMGLYQE